MNMRQIKKFMALALSAALFVNSPVSSAAASTGSVASSDPPGISVQGTRTSVTTNDIGEAEAAQVLTWAVGEETLRNTTVQVNCLLETTLTTKVDTDAVEGDYSIDYTGSDEDVFEVYSSSETSVTIMGKKPGTATLTATIRYTDAQSTPQADTITATVTVLKNKVRIDHMRFSYTNSVVEKKYDGTTDIPLDIMPRIGSVILSNPELMIYYGDSSSYKLLKAEFLDADVGDDKLVIFTVDIPDTYLYKDCLEFDTTVKEVKVKVGTRTDWKWKTLYLAGNQGYVREKDSNGGALLNKITPRSISLDELFDDNGLQTKYLSPLPASGLKEISPFTLSKLKDSETGEVITLANPVQGKIKWDSTLSENQDKAGKNNLFYYDAGNGNALQSSRVVKPEFVPDDTNALKNYTTANGKFSGTQTIYRCDLQLQSGETTVTENNFYQVINIDGYAEKNGASAAPMSYNCGVYQSFNSILSVNSPNSNMVVNKLDGQTGETLGTDSAPTLSLKVYDKNGIEVGLDQEPTEGEYTYKLFYKGSLGADSDREYEILSSENMKLIFNRIELVNTDFELYDNVSHTFYNMDTASPVVTKEYDDTLKVVGNYSLVMKNRPSDAELENYIIPYNHSDKGLHYLSTHGTDAADDLYIGVCVDEEAFNKTPLAKVYKLRDDLITGFMVAKGEITKKQLTPVLASADISKIYDGTTDLGEDIQLTALFEPTSTELTYVVKGSSYASAAVGDDIAITLGDDITLQRGDANIAKNIELVGLDSLRPEGKISPRRVSVELYGDASADYKEAYSHTAEIAERQATGEGVAEGDTIEVYPMYYKDGQAATTATSTRPTLAGSYHVTAGCANANYELACTDMNFTIEKGIPEIEKTLLKYVRYGDTELKTIDALRLAKYRGEYVAGTVKVTAVDNPTVGSEEGTAVFDAANTSKVNDTALNYQVSSNNEEAVGKTLTITYTFTPNDTSLASVDGLEVQVECIDKATIDDFTVDAESKTYDGQAPSNIRYSFDATKLTGYQDTNVSCEYTYTGTMANNTVYGTSSEAPTAPGKYVVTVTYLSDSHKGIAQKSFEIKPKQLIFDQLTITDRSYRHNDTSGNFASGTPYHLDGVVGSDAVTVQWGNGTKEAPVFRFADDEVGENRTAVAEHWDISLTGDDAWKYLAPVAPRLKASISKCGVSATTVQITENRSKVYDGSDVIPELTISFLGVDVPESGKLLNSHFVSKDVGNDIRILPGEFATDAENARIVRNYNFDYSFYDLKGTITAKPIGVEISGPCLVYYDGEYSHTATTTTDVIEGDTVNLIVKYRRDGSDVIVDKPTDVGKYYYVVECDNANYAVDSDNLTYPEGKNYFEITQAAITFEKGDNVSKTIYNYDTGKASITATDFAPTYLGRAIEGTIDITSVSADTGNLFALKPDADTDSAEYRLNTGLAETVSGSLTVMFTFTPTNSNLSQKSGTFTLNVVPRTVINDITVAINGVTYGEALAEPTCSSATVDGLSGGNWEIKYTGTTAENVAYESETAPALPGNYTVTATYINATHKGSAQKSFTIGKKTLTPDTSSLEIPDKVYDGQTKAVASGDVTLSGVVSGDSVTFATEFLYRFEDKNVGTNKKVSVTNWDAAAITGEDAWKYDFSAGTAPTHLSADITPKQVTLRRADTGAVTKEYDGGTAYTPAMAFTFDGVEGETDISVTATGIYFADKNVGTDIAMRFDRVTSDVSGADGNNYSLIYPAVSGSITPATLSVAIEGPANVEYGVGFTHSARILSGLLGTDTAADVPLNVTYSYADIGGNITGAPNAVGKYKVNCLPNGGNYTFSVSEKAFEITQAKPTINAEITRYLRYSELAEKKVMLSEYTAFEGRFVVKNISDGNISGITLPAMGTEPTEYLSYQLTSPADSTNIGNTASVEVTFVPADTNYYSVDVKLNIVIVDEIVLDDITVDVSDITYGETLAAPVSSSATVDTAGGRWKIEYSGVRADGTAYEASEAAPTEPGNYNVTANYWDDTYIGMASKAFVINKKPITYTGVKVVDREYDGTTYVKVEGPTGYAGILPGDSVEPPVRFDAVGYEFHTQYATPDVGENKQILTSYNEQATVSGGDAWKYTATDIVLTGNVTAPTTKPVQIGGSWDTVIVEKDIETEYQSLLQKMGNSLYATVDDMKNAMRQAAMTVNSDIGNNVRFYDLQVWRTDGNGTLQTDGHIEGAGATILIPYPEGTDHSYIFVIIHMKSDGTIERLLGRNTEYGIEFTCNSTSPFLLAWTEAPVESSGSTGGNSGSGTGNTGGNSGSGTGSIGGNSGSGSGSTGSIGIAAAGKTDMKKNTGSSVTTIPAGTASASEEEQYQPSSESSEEKSEEDFSESNADSNADASASQEENTTVDDTSEPEDHTTGGNTNAVSESEHSISIAMFAVLAAVAALIIVVIILIAKRRKK